MHFKKQLKAEQIELSKDKTIILKYNTLTLVRYNTIMHKVIIALHNINTKMEKIMEKEKNRLYKAWNKRFS